ncbi:hypothetical protein KSS87_017137 [Heliosperma pusillum]|nr:hypothetical protein KSS87_017137 [Heliosperma pusillum]
MCCEFTVLPLISSNIRESEPNSWEDMMKDELDRKKYPRMPWHDVHCALMGPPCRDVARHFVQRWNHAKRNKAPNEQAIPLLMPQHHMVIPHYLGRNLETVVEDVGVADDLGIKRQDSFSSRLSSQDIPLLLPQETGQNGDLSLNGMDTTSDSLDHQMKIMRTVPFPFRKAKIEPFLSDTPMKAFVEDFESVDGVIHKGIKSIDKEWWETQERGSLVVASDETGQVGPCVSCRCQVIRSVSQWSAGTSQTEQSIHNAYCTLIEKAEHFIYIEGGVDDAGAASVRAIMHWQYRTICRDQKSILQNLYKVLGPKAHDYISFFGLRAHGKLFDNGPIATSQVYVHSKIMIIDDCMALIGSANINDRSLLGSRDSEIGVLIEDKEVITSRMGGKPWKAGKFTLSLRLSLWAEHLGLRPGEIPLIYDPVADTTYKDIWMATAKVSEKYASKIKFLEDPFSFSHASLFYLFIFATILLIRVLRLVVKIMPQALISHPDLGCNASNYSWSEL